MAHIRRAQLEDQEGMHKAHMRSIREICIHDHGKEEIKGWGYREMKSQEHWQQSFANPEHFFWVVEHNTKIEGHAFIRIERETKKAHIHSLYLTPVVYKQGLGSKLMDLMCATAKAHKITEISLESSLTAHSFYQKWGFVDTKPTQKVIVGGYPVRCIPMKKIL